MDKEKGKRLRLSADEVELINQSRANSLDNFNDNTSLDMHLADRGIQKKDVVSVKHWQTMSGENRFSVVTKESFGVDMDGLFDKITSYIKDNAPKYPAVKRKKGGNHLLIINPADIHIGKYANSRETGDEYNSDIACERVLEGVQGLIDQSRGFKIEKVLFMIGNDILHTDTVDSRTTRGTPQDTTGRWWEHFEIALDLYVKCVEMLREVAPVDCVHNMSNHDYQSGFHLAHALKSWFRNDKSVTVDAGVAYRKFYVYGKSLIGTEHGDGVKLADLPLIMANENPTDWAKCPFRYWYVHHIHHKVKMKWQDAKDYIGCTVEYLRSPSGTDAWHHQKGYGAYKAVEGFVHHKDSGQVARLTYYF